MMNNNNINSWQYAGNVKFPVQLKTSAAGKVFLSVVLDNGSSGMGAIMFDTVAEAFHVMAGQGNSVVLKGHISQRKDKSTGYYHNSLICNGFSVDGGASWHTEQSLKGQQTTQQNQGYQQQQQIPVQQQQQVRPPVQPSEAFQQPTQNEQVAHLQQCQQQFSQQQPQQVQQQPVQRPIEGFQDRQVQQGDQPSAQAVEAQSVLYSAPAQEQQQQPIHSEDTFDEEIVF